MKFWTLARRLLQAGQRNLKIKGKMKVFLHGKLLRKMRMLMKVSGVAEKLETWRVSQEMKEGNMIVSDIVGFCREMPSQTRLVT